MFNITCTKLKHKRARFLQRCCTYDNDSGHEFLEKGNRHIGGGSGVKEEGLDFSLRFTVETAGRSRSVLSD